MEWAFEFLVKVFGELLLNLCGELLIDLLASLWESKAAPRGNGRSREWSLWVTLPLLAFCGAGFALIGLHFFPHPFLHHPLARLGMLFAGPCLIAWGMIRLGRWRANRGQNARFIERFAQAFTFAFAAFLTRYLGTY